VRQSLYLTAQCLLRPVFCGAQAQSKPSIEFDFAAIAEAAEPECVRIDDGLIVGHEIGRESTGAGADSKAVSRETR
jgi:hypothetical protein